MSRRLRNIMLVVLPIALATSIASATAARATLPGCSNPADSALNQYCDSVPAPGGAQLPAPGAARLAGSLPPQIVRQINAAGGPGGTPRPASARRRLLSLPAPPARDDVPSSSAAATITSVWSLSSWLIAVLVGSALALAAVAIARGRRRRPGTS